MIPHLLAAIDNESVGLIVQGTGTLATITLTLVLLFRSVGGKDGERQIEPTAMHAAVVELKFQTTMLNKLDREMGEVKTSVTSVDEKITAQAQNVENAFRRINAISVESAGVKARVDGLENREGHKNA